MKKESQIKLTMDQSPTYEEEIIVKYNKMTQTLEKLIGQIQLYSINIIGKRKKQSHNISLSDIYYFESIDNKIFIYLSDGEYELDSKLYEIEEQLRETSFIRLVNLYIKSG